MSRLVLQVHRGNRSSGKSGYGWEKTNLHSLEALTFGLLRHPDWRLEIL
jgi:hypothetical protein